MSGMCVKTQIVQSSTNADDAAFDHLIKANYFYHLLKSERNQKTGFVDLKLSLSGCHIAYIDTDTHAKVSCDVAGCHHNHVLTIGDQS